MPFADQNSNSENTDSFPVFAEPKTPDYIATAITTGNSHSCALHQDGTISCWGNNQYDQLGGGTVGDYSLTPVRVASITDATAITAGGWHSCALHQDGTISCWGNNQYGQLGDRTDDYNSSSLAPEGVAGITDATAIAAGSGHSCALHQDGTISCWGNNQYGQLGDETDDYNSSSLAPVGVAGITDATAIAAGYGHSCALRQDGTISCWGNNYWGQLGDRTEDNSLVPVRVVGIADATAINTGTGHSCALHQNGTISCWGNNEKGQLGNGTGGNSSAPVGVASITDATAINTGTGHSCALHQNGTISCWGNNEDSQLGDGTLEDSSVPVGVAGITDATAINTGDEHSCALHEDGTISCWGNNQDGQLGDGTGGDSLVLPVGVASITDATAITASGYYGHSCALRKDGTISCWGNNQDGQLGDGTLLRQWTEATTTTTTPVTTTQAASPTRRPTLYYYNTYVGNSLVPVRVVGITDATAVAAGDEHSCALHEDGTISCWGNNSSGRLGDGTGGDSSVPVRVVGITDATAIAAGYNHSCALHQDGTISCWGNNYWGQLGNGTLGGGYSVPVKVAGITDATAITASVGYYPVHSCALHRDGTISCWGSGRLGDGTGGDSSVPVRVVGITDATAIAAGYGHSCALRQDGTISCWGDNDYGKLGDRTEDNSPVPVQVANITDATAIATGGGHSCALHQDGTISCWGSGPLGYGTGDDSSVPVQVANITDATAIAAGDAHSCALRKDGTISCWGSNSDGQLGYASWLPRFVVGFGG